ncbi:hypothetical protein F5141DRAFT_180595 [Pisolithus sp. B1]|nr:hypothetical protein F5141DRAFT_180595 [Pisolithus sp. B1]
MNILPVQMSLDIVVSLSVAQFSLLYYDYTLTLSREVELFWKRPRRSWPFAIFVANRYLTVLGHVPSSLYWFWSPAVHSNYRPSFNTTHRCNPLRLYHGALIMVVQVVGAIAMIVRVYALYERSRYILAMLVFLAVGANAVGFWVVSSIPSSASVVVPAPAQEPLIGCPDNLSGIETLTRGRSLYLAVAWGGQLLFDVVVFGLTFWRSVHSRTPGQSNISDVLLRDGSLYFAVMSAANIGNITALLVASDNVKDVTPGFTNVISATMISRLMLNLRDSSISVSAAASFPPLSRPSAFALTRGLPGIETTTTAQYP